MKKAQKIILMFILMMILIFIPETRAYNNVELKSNVKKTISSNEKSEEQNENKPECKYKEGEVIITYEKSFWKSDSKLSLGSFFDKYKVDATTQFDDIQIDSDKTVSIDNSDSKGSTLGISLVKSDKHTTKELIDIFKNKDWIISVEPNYVIKTASLTDDTYGKYQWALENTGQITETKELDINPISTSSEKEKVIAVLDTGVDYTHEDLKNVMWVNPYSKEDLPGTYGYDFINSDDDPKDDHFHGTHVAGIIAAEANNNKGVTGTVLGAKNIKIMALKIANYDGNIDVYSAIEAYNYIYKAQELGTNIVAVNNSWGGPAIIDNEENQGVMNSLLSVINLVGEKGTLSVCAAGNDTIELDENGSCYCDIEVDDDNNNKVMKTFLCKYIPCGLESDYIISVGASTYDDKLATFSNYGKSIDVLAPGTQILSTMLDRHKENDWILSRFIPGIYTEEKRNETCDIYYDFENCNITDIPFTTNKGTLSIVNDKSFGNGNKCLKWEFDTTEENDSVFLYLNNTGINKSKVKYLSAMVSTSLDTEDNILMGTNWVYSSEPGSFGETEYSQSWDNFDCGTYNNTRRWTLGITWK